MYEQLLNLDPVKINFSKAGMDMINIVLAFVMYGVALGIKPSLFKEVFKNPNRRFWAPSVRWYFCLHSHFFL